MNSSIYSYGKGYKLLSNNNFKNSLIYEIWASPFHLQQDQQFLVSCFCSNENSKFFTGLITRIPLPITCYLYCQSFHTGFLLWYTNPQHMDTVADNSFWIFIFVFKKKVFLKYVCLVILVKCCIFIKIFQKNFKFMEDEAPGP